jgi:arylsulfatase A-like enzyme
VLLCPGCVRDSRPNILLVSLDTLRADAVEEMPFLRGLAAEGISFPVVYASSNWTLPSHASLFLSQPYSEHRLPPLRARSPFPGERMNEATTTLAEALSAGGYRTWASTEGGYLNSAYGFARGFDEWGQTPGVSHIAEADIEAHRRSLERFLAADRVPPVFAFVHTYRVHDFFTNRPEFHTHLDAADQPWAERGTLLSLFRRNDGSEPPVDFLRRLYRGAAADADQFLRRLVDGALQAPAERPWLVIVTSDHGEGFAPDAEQRHHGTALVEQQLRIPWIAWTNDPAGAWPDPAPIASLIDIAPSILRRAGLEVPATFRGDPHRLTRETQTVNLVPMVESSFFRQGDGDYVEAQLALAQGERALVWIAPLDAPARRTCLRAATPGPGPRGWVPDGDESCRDLDDEARRRVRRWTTTTSNPVAAAGDADAALTEELRSLGYL